MTEQINSSEGRKEFERLSVVFTVLFLAILITPVPLRAFFILCGNGDLDRNPGGGDFRGLPG